jgi:hypothetical protein
MDEGRFFRVRGQADTIWWWIDRIFDLCNGRRGVLSDAMHA